MALPKMPPTMTRNASFVSQSVPWYMEAGKSYTVSITMKNTGNVSWSRSLGYKLGFTSPYGYPSQWGIDRVALPTTTVAPGMTATFRFVLTAPSRSTCYGFQWRMLQENVTWFGGTTPSSSVAVGSPNACYIG